MLLVLFTSFHAPMSEELWHWRLNSLPQILQEKVVRFFRWEDRHSSLLGKLLLREGLDCFGIDPNILSQIGWDRFNRPFLPLNLDFNLSHSGRFVIAAFSDEGRVGVDLEKVHSLDVKKFSSFFSQRQWSVLERSNLSLDAFFDMWTKLESVAKWEGSGIYCDFKRIILHETRADLNGSSCNFRNLTFDNHYPCHIAAGCDPSRVVIKSASFGDQNEA